jgi:hypothetical protein
VLIESCELRPPATTLLVQSARSIRASKGGELAKYLLAYNFYFLSSIMITMNETDDIESMYSSLFQVLDGLWFMKVEAQCGFDLALQIDKDVWKAFGAKEAQRLMRYFKEKEILSESDSSIAVLEVLLEKSLFNKTLKFHVEKTGDNDLYFWVDECKTLLGMKKIGRSDEQTSSVCNEIGFTFYDSFTKAIDPAFTTECIFTPFSTEIPVEAENSVCGWHFSLVK